MTGAGGPYRAQHELAPAYRVIADHIRSASFLMTDGVVPSNEGRGYVLRRIIRRAIRHGFMLGQRAPFFHKLVEDLDRQMGDAYPELRRDKVRVAQVLKAEEERKEKQETHASLLDALRKKLEARVKDVRLSSRLTSSAWTMYSSLNLKLL